MKTKKERKRPRSGPSRLTASVFVGTSVDGFIARKDGGFNFLSAGEGGSNGFEEFVATIDAHAIGRKTFDWACGWLREHPGR